MRADERERRMAREELDRGGDDRGDRVAERVARARPRDDDRRAQRVGLAGDERDEQLLLVREAAVDGRPRAAGFAGDVVERRLGQTDAPDAGRAPRRGSAPPCGLRSAAEKSIT